ncbi:MAG: hypothetical protein PHI73_04235 [Patescibacteria group bacterium]|nr:hypothetical protein [Patescibacteria group bacterium]
MPRFRINYSFLQGVDHHHPDYMKPDAPLERIYRDTTIETSDEEAARAEFGRQKPACTIESIKEAKETD